MDYKEFQQKLSEILKEDISDLALTRKINALFRENDESKLWPVCGKFNATERAIRRIQQRRRQGLCVNAGLEYALLLEEEISRIVNSIV